MFADFLSSISAPFFNKNCQLFFKLFQNFLGKILFFLSLKPSKKF